MVSLLHSRQYDEFIITPQTIWVYYTTDNMGLLHRQYGFITPQTKWVYYTTDNMGLLHHRQYDCSIHIFTGRPDYLIEEGDCHPLISSPGTMARFITNDMCAKVNNDA